MWLDFQWCQTGHAGLHVPERVADMWRNLPAKAVANGGPTYECIAYEDNAVGWWQGDEAIRNLGVERPNARGCCQGFEVLPARGYQRAVVGVVLWALAGALVSALERLEFSCSCPP